MLQLRIVSVVYWSGFLATDPEVRVRFPGLPDFLRSNGSGTGSAQPREYNWGATWKKKERLRSRKTRLWSWGVRCADYTTHLYPQKLALTLPRSGGLSVGIVRSPTRATELLVYVTYMKSVYCQCLPSVRLTGISRETNLIKSSVIYAP
jgi:hypothetical protein